MEEKSNVVININGGNNQILPNATEAVQNFNFYANGGEQKSKAAETGSKAESASNAKDVTEGNEGTVNSDEPEIPYINKVYAKEYADQLRNCADGREVGIIVAKMVKDAGLFEETAKKEMFIEKIMPFLDHLTKGKSVDNIRKHIRNALDEQNMR